MRLKKGELDIKVTPTEGGLRLVVWKDEGYTCIYDEVIQYTQLYTTLASVSPDMGEES